MRIANEDLLNGGTQDMGASFNMRSIWLGHIVDYSIQLVFTGTPSGSLSLQCSNDPGMPNGGQTPQDLNVTNWTDIAGSAVSISAAGNVVWNVQDAGYNFVRVIYTRTGSTGTVTSARVNVKGV